MPEPLSGIFGFQTPRHTYFQHQPRMQLPVLMQYRIFAIWDVIPNTYPVSLNSLLNSPKPGHVSQ